MFSVYVRGNDKRLKAEFETLKKVKDNLLEGKHIRFLEWDEKETGYNLRYRATKTRFSDWSMNHGP